LLVRGGDPLIRKFLTFALCGSVSVLAPAFSFQAEKLPEKHVLRREVAVTFDDLPAPEDSVASNDVIALRSMTKRLLDGLRVNRIPAVGFVNEQKLYGDNDFEARVGILRMWVNAGFELGNHTFSHLDLNATPLTDYEEDVLRGEIATKILLRKKGKRLRYFRYPYLDLGPNLAVRREFEQFLARHGYTVAPVTIDNEEYMFGVVYASALRGGDQQAARGVADAYIAYMDHVFDYFEGLSRAVVGREIRQVLLLHADSLNADHLANLIRMMERRGYHFISLERALQDKAYHLPDNYSGGGGVSWIEHWAFTKGKKTPRGPEAPEFVKKQYEAISN
jgi:peptidoglycan/xylan/chitin deacetylase (PgdA/CDA1 family)